MAFRGRGTVVVPIGAPTASVDIGDAFQTGGSGLSADAGHQHAFPPPAAAVFGPAGAVDLSGLYAPFNPAAFAPAGTVDLSPFYFGKGVVGDAMVYVHPGGNDANDGLSWGSAKATLAAAVAALPGRSGTVLMAAGTFPLGVNTLWLTTDGTATGTPSKIRLIGAGTDQTIVTYTGTGVAISAGTSVNLPGGAFVARDFAVDGAGSGASSRGLYLKRYQQASSLSNVKSTGFGLANFHAYRCYGIALWACHFTGGAGWGALMDNSNGFVAVATRFSSNTSGGVRVFFNDGTGVFDEAGTAMAAGTLFGCLIEDNAGPGASFESASMIDVIGGYVEGNAGPAGLGQFVVTGTAASNVSFVRIAGVRFSAVGANRTAARAIYCDFGEVHTEGNNSFNHTTCFLEVTANGTVHWGPGHRDGTRPEGTNRDAKVLVDNSRQSQNVRLSDFADGVTITVSFKISDPAASVTNGDVPLANGGTITTPRLDAMGMRWEAEAIAVRATSGAPSAGTITFFPKSGTTDLSAALNVQLAVGTALQSNVGNARSTAAGATMGCGYTTSATYADPAGTHEYMVYVTYRLKPFCT